MSFLFDAVIMFKHRTSGGKKKGKDHTRHITQRLRDGSSLEVNKPREETNTSREESSQKDKDVSWDDVTSVARC